MIGMTPLLAEAPTTNAGSVNGSIAMRLHESNPIGRMTRDVSRDQRQASTPDGTPASDGAAPILAISATTDIARAPDTRRPIAPGMRRSPTSNPPPCALTSLGMAPAILHSRRLNLACHV